MIVDPQRDVEQYLADARALGLTIRHVFLTHFHADFVAGHLELARASELDLVAPAPAKKVITEDEARALRAAAEARDDAIQVDAFGPEAYRALRG